MLTRLAPALLLVAASVVAISPVDSHPVVSGCTTSSDPLTYAGVWWQAYLAGLNPSDPNTVFNGLVWYNLPDTGGVMHTWCTWRCNHIEECYAAPCFYKVDPSECHSTPVHPLIPVQLSTYAGAVELRSCLSHSDSDDGCNGSTRIVPVAQTLMSFSNPQPFPVRYELRDGSNLVRLGSLAANSREGSVWQAAPGTYQLSWTAPGTCTPQLPCEPYKVETVVV